MAAGGETGGETGGAIGARRIRDVAEFPGWARFGELAARYIEPRPGFEVLDIGGGANPFVPERLARSVGCTLLDIDPDELAKAPALFGRRVCADATAPTEEFVALVGRGAFDLAASHMFLEHVRDPDAVHRNLYAALRPGGRAVHAYPVRNNLPLAANAALPEAVSRRIVRIAQPERDLAGSLGKFPAFYRRCHAPSARARRYFEGFGFEVERHEGYAGHDYYRRVPLLGALERLNRRLVVAAQAPWICFAVLVLRKPAAA